MSVVVFAQNFVW